MTDGPERPLQGAKPYRVLAVSLYDEEAQIADHVTRILRSAGWPRANRSFVIREALLRLDEDLGTKTSDEILRYFIDRQARRVKGRETASSNSDGTAPDRSGTR